MRSGNGKAASGAVGSVPSTRVPAPLHTRSTRPRTAAVEREATASQLRVRLAYLCFSDIVVRLTFLSYFL